MSDQVLDSWEDMIDDNNEILVNQLEDIRLEDSLQNKAVATNDSNTLNESNNCSALTTNSNTLNDNLNVTSIKILKRPTNFEKSRSVVNDSDKGQDRTDVNQYQQSICPQITLEDNTRTQYVPQVRILKRPNAHKDKSGLNDRSINANRSQTNNKTLEEREAEYAKARLRIMGSASAPEEEIGNQNDVRISSQTSSSCNTSPNRSPHSGPRTKAQIETNVPIIRMPIGPDGTSGFSRELTSEQR